MNDLTWLAPRRIHELSQALMASVAGMHRIGFILDRTADFMIGSINYIYGSGAALGRFPQHFLIQERA